jgi:hypothetical protein
MVELIIFIVAVVLLLVFRNKLPNDGTKPDGHLDLYRRNTTTKPKQNLRDNLTSCTKPTYTQPVVDSEPLLCPSNTMYISREDKANYLESPKWKALKKQRLVLAKHKCEVPGCTTVHNLECHHVTYERLTIEYIEDLRIVCRTHHQAIHNKLGYDRATDYPISILKEKY